jgi:hypothetical protein
MRRKENRSEQTSVSEMKNSRKSWVSKLRPEMEPKIVQNPRGGGRMLVPTPLLVANEIKKTPEGETITPEEIRNRLAQSFNADLTCPLTTGIFINILAGAAEEELAAGLPVSAPYWRVVKKGGDLSEKTPPGPIRQAEHLRREGHRLEESKGSWRLVR